VTFWNRSGSADPYGTAGLGIRIRIPLFSSVADKMPTKNKIFFLLHFEGTFTVCTIHQSSKLKCQKNSRITVFLTFFCMLMEKSGSGSVQVMTDPDPGGAKTYGSTILLNSVPLFFAVGAGFIFMYAVIWGMTHSHVRRMG
jgi:hypothetical protein